jgi:signal transduction histidine kinase
VGSDAQAVQRPLEGFVKLALNLRLVALLLTVLWLPASDPDGLQVVALLLAGTGTTSLLGVLAWGRIGRFVLDHPVAMVPDLLLSIAVLAAVGLDTPFGLFVLSTALLGGALYGWVGAAAMGLALVLAYVGGIVLAGERLSIAEAFGTPVLIPAAAAGGAAVRDLLVRQHRATLALAEASLNHAAATERTRLAREMHDTLAKTLHGLALSATAIPQLLQHDPERAVTTADGLAGIAERAAQEARALIVDLRQDDLERPLGEALAEASETWAQRSGTTVTTDLDPCAGLSPSARYELFCIAREALRNAHEHGRAGHVNVTLVDDVEVRLTVTDDGRGFVVPVDLHHLAEAGHFGVLGMRERAEAAGGRLALTSAPGRGTTVEVHVPRSLPGQPEGQLRPPRSGADPLEEAR